MKFSAQAVIPWLVAGTFFMENLDSTVVVTALPQMATSFGVEPVQVSVGISAYVLTMAVLIPVSGWIADRLGARLVYSIAILIFALGSILCGISQSLPFFIFAEIFQGIGGAMMVPVGRLVVLRTTAKQDLVKAIGTITWPGLIAPVLGPPVGGFITTYFSWHWIFFLNVPLGIVAFLFVLKLIPNGHSETRKPFDVVGFVLTGIASFAIMFFMDLTSRGDYNWYALSACLLGAFVTGGLAIWHANHTAHPMLDLWAMRLRSYTVVIYGGSLFRLCVGALPYILPLLFQLGFGYTPFESGFLVLAVFAGNLVMKLFTTAVIRRYNFKTILLVNGLLNAAGTLGCAFLTPETPVFLTALLLFVNGLTRSMQLTALNTVSFSEVPDDKMSGANGFSSLINQITWGMGITFGGALLGLGEVIHGDAAGTTSVWAFHIAFFFMSIVAFLAVLDVFTLKADAGDNIRLRQKASQTKPAIPASKTGQDLPESQ